MARAVIVFGGTRKTAPWSLPKIAAGLGIPIASLLVDDLVLAEIRVSDESLERVTRQIIETEERARERMVRDAKVQIEDKVWRAYGTLRYCRSIHAREVINLCSAVRLGVAMNLPGLCPLRTLNELLVLSQPAHLQRGQGGELSPAERNIVRAQLVRERLAAAERETRANPQG